jgi:CheY-like chemotaxis protein
MDKVLIADDDRILLKRLTKGLGNYSDKFKAILVKDGKEAINVLKQEPVSLLVTDIQMPRLNGIILLAYVHTYHPSTPCIVTTAYGTSRLKAKLPKDVLRFIQKPFDVNNLAQVIMAALERHVPRENAEGISVVSFLNMIELEQISCIFEIQSPDKPTGTLYFENGVLFDAKSGDIGGEAAALELIARNMSTYKFKVLPQEKLSVQIKTGLHELIRNAVIDDLETELTLV